MYNQFFGNYLFSQGYVTKEHLISALIRQSKETVHISTLALYNGYVSALEIEYIMEQASNAGKKFSDIALEYGYITHEQLISLINTKAPDFLALGQILINDGVFSYVQFGDILANYRSNSEFLDLELNDNNKDDIKKLIESFSIVSETQIPAFGKLYLELLFNNFVRFIGDDFTTLPPSYCTEFATERCVSQAIIGEYVVNTYLNMSEDTAIDFASRYSDENFQEFDEYVAAAIEDFINLHNGLFIVNASNDDSSKNLTIGTIERHTNTIMNFENATFLFPVCYPFGLVYFIMEVVSLSEIDKVLYHIK